MPLPTDLQTGALTGIVRLLQDGSSLSVIATITPDFGDINDLPGGAAGDTGSLLVGPVAPIVIDTSIIRAGSNAVWDYSVDANKRFTVNLLGTSELINPLKFTYTIVIKRKSDGVVLKNFSFTIPAGVTIDLSAVAPVKASAGAGAAIINVNGGGQGGISKWDQLQEKPQYIAAGTTAADARAAIGAVTLGITSTTALRGNYRPDWNGGIDNVPIAFPPLAHQHSLDDVGQITDTGRKLYQASSAGTARSNGLGFTGVGNSLVTQVDLAALQDYLGIAGLITAALTAALGATPTLSYDANFVPAANARPVIFITEALPAGMRSQDRWLADAPAS